MTACLLAVWHAGGSESLPALGWAIAFLFVAIVQDVRHLRIPNWLTFPSLAIALGLGAARDGLPGLGAALLGAGTALAVLIVPFALRRLGAGNVKAAMVLGALWSADAFLPALAWTLVAGAATTVALSAVRSQRRDPSRRWRGADAVIPRTPSLGPPVNAAGAGLPFAVALGLGAAAYQLWGVPWS